MTRFNTIILYALSVILLAMLLPWLYSFATSKPEHSPFTLYSSVIGDFARISTDEKNKLIYESVAGKRYTETEFDSILPFFYYRQLVADGRLPEGLTVKEINRSNFVFRTSPAEINKPSVGLYQLLESKSGRVDLEMPSDVFRITGSGIEFIDMASNTINKGKSDAFTEVFRERGFAYPSHLVVGDPNPRKEYDNGYLLTDKEGILYNLRMVKGTPSMQRINTSVKIRRVYVAEFSSRSIVAFVNDVDNNFYAISAENYSWHKLPFKFNSERESLLIFGNMLDWTVKVGSEEGSRLYAVSADDYSLIKTMTYSYDKQLADKVSGYIFPFKLNLKSSMDDWVAPRLSEFSVWALLLNLFLAVTYFFFSRRIVQSAAIIPFGLFMAIPLIAYNRLKLAR